MAGCLSGVSLSVLLASLVTTSATAQTTSGGAQNLPPVVVEKQNQAQRRAKPMRTRQATAARASRAPRGQGSAARSTAASSGGAIETATGPVRGYIANQSATGTKTDTPLRETPQSITVVTADRVRDQGATTVQEALRYVPGVFADAYGPDSRGDYPRFRGQDPNIYLDGTRMVNVYTFNEWRPEPYTLERMEVLRGPASVLYGDTSTAGLLNLISKRPQEQEYREIGVQYGTFNRKQIQTDMTGKLTKDGEWLYRFVGVFRDSDYQTDHINDDRIVIAPSLTWRPTKDTNWTVMGTYQKDKSKVGSFFPIEGTLYAGPNGRIPVNRFTGDPTFDRYQTETGAVSSLFEHSFGDVLKLRQNMRFAHVEGIYNFTYPDVYGDPANPFVDAERRSVNRYVSGRSTTKDSFTMDNNAELKLATGPVEHKVLLGFDYRRLLERAKSGYYLDTTPFDLYAPVYTPVMAPELTGEPRTLQSLAGIYVQDQMRFGPWRAVLGMRQDFVSSDVADAPKQNDKATTGRAALMYDLPFGLTPYVTYAQSFTPIFGSHICVDYCKPQRGEMVEVGFKYQPNKRLAINGALFDTTENNRLASGPDPEFSVQIGKVRIRGVELEVLSSVTSDLDLIGTYSYLDAKVQSGDNTGKRLETVPEQQASLWAKYRLSAFGLPGLTLGAGARYIGKTWDGVDNFSTPDYTLFDAMARYDTGPWTFQVNATNLGDKRHVTTCLARGDCFYGARRTVLGNVTYRF
ncbi:TonB-dependent siderophore receptor [Bradyrhizobium prioriisuperbiae]|uniref:TonB-dependent siderophore receptor n=1 Tax=Bradyrhizobium prioriisuperbiae TaxID=2854389 RepID=UPI0028EE5BA9|nr:TonB-dependent siderophore receptor [Bradyrhizobium prioritasuperba]